jgi:methylglyoxal synthase
MTDTPAKTLALIAHDGKKQDMVAFAMKNENVLKAYHILATNTTGTMLIANTKLDVEQMLSGPVGGDAQIAAAVAEGRVAAVFFFVDPLGKHPHDPDIQSLLRICNVHNIPLATNTATASFLLSDRTI